MRTLKHLAVAAAMVGLVAPVQAEYYPGSTDFEGDSPLADACWSNVVEAAIEADVSAKYFKAVIEFPIAGDSDPGEEPEPDPEPDPEE